MDLAQTSRRRTLMDSALPDLSICWHPNEYVVVHPLVSTCGHRKEGYCGSRA